MTAKRPKTTAVSRRSLRGVMAQSAAGRATAADDGTTTSLGTARRMGRSVAAAIPDPDAEQHGEQRQPRQSEDADAVDLGARQGQRSLLGSLRRDTDLL